MARVDVPELKLQAGSPSAVADIEKISVEETVEIASEPQNEQVSKPSGILPTITRLLARFNLETNGIVPVPPEERTDPRTYQMFFVWFSANLNILTMTNGTLGPAVYGLGIRDSLLVIVVVDIITCAFPAYFGVFGPKLGARGMVQARFSWGYYGAIIPGILVTLSLQGYLILNTIIGGQTLGSISPSLSDSVGIVIIGLFTLLVVFSGYKVLHWYEMFVWIPNVIAFITMLAVSGKHLVEAPLTGKTPVTPSVIMTYGGLLAASVVNWTPLMPDQGVYHSHKTSTWRIFFYSYFGLLLSIMPVHLLGASFTGGALFVPAWKAGLGNGNNIGGLIGAVLLPAGGFGKFLLVLLSLTTPSQCAPAMYTVCNSVMTLAPFLAKVPRFLLAIVSTAIIIPVAIVGSNTFYSIFSNILGFIGYWLAPFCAIILTEHFVFRKNRWASYDILDAWDKPHHRNLPRSWASVFTFLTTIGFIVLCIQKQWWTGPIARAGTGDVGMLFGFCFSVLVFLCARWLEKRWDARRPAASPRDA
ncbi:uncharacterized protein FIBRA_07862 [Fibroporia radiculosa]|uniref:Purine-cytosine permease n=1 Tax=Fibroporia radiculosa TaxID=599839 RepID=J4GFR6_9APHY|nr:uncharacterized protein FIBRA_07862 [Fibroporia radiculosa]CCM05633.1 predicted protein [Fibroporia radiculosa]